MTADELASIVKTYSTAKELYLTNTGKKISPNEHKFINAFMISGDPAMAARDAGFVLQGKNQTYKAIGSRLLRKDYIYDEILYRIEEMNKASIADEQEIMQYFTAVMRNQEKDQFGLDAPLSERTAAAKELAKRIIDIPSRNSDSAIQINLNWQRDEVPALEVANGV